MIRKIAIAITLFFMISICLIPAVYGSQVNLKENKDDNIKNISYRNTEYWAVIVGIADYDGTENDLPVSEKHMHMIFDALITKNNWDEDHIKNLINENAKKQDILTALDWLITNADSDDIVLFSYQGHGSSIDDENGDEEDGKDEGIVPWEGIEGFITDDVLDEKFDQIDADGMMLVFHSCLSGGLIDDPDSFLEALELSDKFNKEFLTDIEGNNRVIIMSSMDQGLALAFPSLTRFLSYGFNGFANRNFDDFVTAEEASIYAKNKVLLVFLMLFCILPQSIVSFLISSIYAKIVNGYWVLPIPQIYDGYDGDLPVIEL